MSRSYLCAHVRDLVGYTPGEQPRVPGLIKLNTNENPYPPSPKVRQALHALGDDALRLYPDPVCRALREQIAARHGVRPEQVFVGNGSDEILALCTRAFVEADGTIASFDPSYSLYPVLAAIRPARMITVALAQDFTWQMPEGFRADLFYLTHPNAPTSIAFPRDRVIALCESFDGVILIDEAYADFAPENYMDLAGRYPNVLVSRSFSKSYALAGARVGYLVGDAALIATLYAIKDSYNVNALSQTTALAAFQDEAYMRANIARIITTRARVAAELTTRSYQVYPSATNFLWIHPPPAIGAADLYAHLRTHNILTRYFPGPRTGALLRVTIGTDAQMDAFLDALPDLAIG